MAKRAVFRENVIYKTTKFNPLRKGKKFRFFYSKRF
jgi:hypothetical protein